MSMYSVLHLVEDYLPSCFQLVDRALAAIIGSTATLAALAMLQKVRSHTY